MDTMDIQSSPTSCDSKDFPYIFSEEDEEDDDLPPVRPPRSLLENANLGKLSMPIMCTVMGPRTNSSLDITPKCRIRGHGHGHAHGHAHGREDVSPLSLTFSTTSDLHLVDPSPYSATTEDFEEKWNSIDYEHWNAQQASAATTCPVHELVEHHAIPELSENYAYGDFNLNSYPSYSVSGSTASSARVSFSMGMCSANTTPISKRLRLIQSDSNQSDVSDICLEFPFYTKADELNFDVSQRQHNQRINGDEVEKSRQIGQDLFHQFHMSAWQEKRRKAQRKERKKQKAMGN